MDNTLITWAAEFVGLAGAAFWGGMKGGKKSLKNIEARLTTIEERLGIKQPPSSGNGKVTLELGLSERPHTVQYQHEGKAK